MDSFDMTIGVAGSLSADGILQSTSRSDTSEASTTDPATVTTDTVPGVSGATITVTASPGSEASSTPPETATVTSVQSASATTITVHQTATETVDPELVSSATALQSQIQA